MKSVFIFIYFCFSVFAMTCTFVNSPNSWKIKSPDGKIVIDVELFDLSKKESNMGSLCYSINYEANQIVEKSPLGLDRDDESFSKKLIFVKRQNNKIHENYKLYNGSRSDCVDQAHETILSFTNENGAQVDLVIRAYKDGVAFKYSFPENSDIKRTILHETTGFKIPAGTAYIMPYDNPGQYWPAYENYYGVYDVGTSSPTKAGWAMPALFKINNGQNYLLIAESGLDGTYCGTRLEQEAPQGLYKIRFPEKGDGEGVGKVEPSSTLPWETTWKVIIIGEKAGDIIESNLITNLADAAIYQIEDYIKPGRASWSWWSDSDSPRNFKKQKTFIDLAAEMSWEYYLLDANWNFEPGEDLLDFIHYANEKGIGVLVWYNSGGPHNIVTEAPRDLMYEKTRRRNEFKWLKDIGVRGVKVDFWQSDKQETIQYYIDLLKDAHEFGIMVNFHGCTVPRGWHRTYPNLLTMEAVMGAESYKFHKTYPENAPWHNVNLVFTRNVVGPMDYTPVTFSDADYPHLTTYAHELALSVAFQSGILHFADKVQAYLDCPDKVIDFLKNVPVTWDDTQCVAGEPAEFVVLARKKGDNWIIAGINGLKQEKTITIEPSRYIPEKSEIVIIGDGETDRTFNVEEIEESDNVIDVTMRPFGGFVMTITAAK